MLVWSLKCTLGPLLLWQGRRVRRTTLRLPEPPGPRRGGSGPLRLLVVGDSSAAGVGVDSFEETLTGQLVQRLGGPERVSWMLVARTGWTTDQATRALAAAGPGPFDLVVTALGVNDVTAGLSPEASQAAHLALLRQLREGNGARAIFVTEVPPMGHFPALPRPLRWYLGLCSARYQRALESVAPGAAEGAECRLLRLSATAAPRAGLMARDGFHPGPGVYSEWAARVHELWRPA